MTIFKDFSPDVDQMSIDEAFIDLTGTEYLFGPPEETAKKIDDLKQVFIHLDDSTKGFNSSEKSDFAKQLLIDSAKKKNIALKLRKGSW